MYNRSVQFIFHCVLIFGLKVWTLSGPIGFQTQELSRIFISITNSITIIKKEPGVLIALVICVLNYHFILMKCMSYNNAFLKKRCH